MEKKHFNRFLDEIYIQINGVPENANQFVLAYLKLLVSKGFTKKVLYARLPTGHTHEVINTLVQEATYVFALCIQA